MTAVSIVESALRIVAAVAPGVLAAVTAQESDEEAIARALEAAKALPVRTGPGGRWAAEDAAQDARVRGEE